MTLPQKDIKEELQEFWRKEEEKRTGILANQAKIPYIDLRFRPIDPDALALIPEEKARTASVIAFALHAKTVKIAAASLKNPATVEALDELKREGYQIEPSLASLSGINEALEHYKFAPPPGRKITGEIAISAETISAIANKINVFQDVKKNISQYLEDATQTLSFLLAAALKVGASDIHLEPAADFLQIRFRLDGVLQDITSIEIKKYRVIRDRIKLISGMKINLTNVAQDGRFSIKKAGEEIEIRVSDIPGQYGEIFVLRLLDPKMIRVKLEDLGWRGDDLEIVKRQLNRPNGMILNTGPTGSGKTTTLYAFLQKLNEPGIKIITIEDPIEYHLEGIQQTQVNPKAGYTFANGLRSILRQDPDVILVGEIRDYDTAEIALNSALTGHLVFSTLHTNDAPGAIPRLVDMKVNQKLIPPALNLVIAQRLVRKICSCAEKYEPSKEIQAKITKCMQSLPARVKKPGLQKIILMKPKGCQKCNMLGYKGRIGVFELFEITDEVAKVISETPNVSAIGEMALKSGMVTMLQDGILKMLGGITSLEEIERVLGEL